MGEVGGEAKGVADCVFHLCIDYICSMSFFAVKMFCLLKAGVIECFRRVNGKASRDSIPSTSFAHLYCVKSNL